MSDQNSWFPSREVDNAVTTGDQGAVSSPPSGGRISRMCGRIWRRGGDKAAPIGVVGVLAAGLLIGPSTATAKPCQYHAGAAKKACVKQVKRNAQAWPPRPKEWEIKRRIGVAQWRKAERVAYCETGGNWQHYPHGTYIGGLGMYRGTYAYGARRTGYRYPSEGATKAEQIAIAIAAFPITRGWSGWGCGGA